MIKIICTDEQWRTIYTALRMEYERNYGAGTDAERLLKDAIEVVSNREVCK